MLTIPYVLQSPIPALESIFVGYRSIILRNELTPFHLSKSLLMLQVPESYKVSLISSFKAGSAVILPERRVAAITEDATAKAFICRTFASSSFMTDVLSVFPWASKKKQTIFPRANGVENAIVRQLLVLKQICLVFAYIPFRSIDVVGISELSLLEDYLNSFGELGCLLVCNKIPPMETILSMSISAVFIYSSLNHASNSWTISCLNSSESPLCLSTT